MVFILVTTILPPHKGEEYVKLYASGKQAKYPDFVKPIHRFVVMDYDTKGYALYEVPDDKIMEAMKAIGKRYSTYFTIEGFKAKMEILMESKDVLAMLGLG